MNVITLLISTSDEFSIECLVNNVVCEYQVIDSSINIFTEVEIGFHLLSIRLIGSQQPTIKIVDALLDGNSFRHTLYMMYTVDQETSNKRQTTILTDYNNVVYLPFVNPMAHWIGICAEKVPYNLLAGGLYEQFEVYYPESVTIPSYYPKLLQDFFITNLNFHLHHKISDPYYNATIPYANIIKNINYDEQVLAGEFLDNVDYLKDIARIPKQNEYDNSNNPWLSVDLIINPNNTYNLSESFLADVNKLPNLYKFFQDLKINTIVHAFIGILAPREYISPHCDTYTEFKNVNELKGCSQIYIPINFKPGNLFKMANVGLLPLDRPLLINNHNFAHALINDSDSYRFALAIVGSKLDA